MRVRYEMAYSTGFPTWQAECDLPDKKAKDLFKNLKEDQYCMWAELVSEEEDTYMNIIDEFDHKNARELYRIKQELDKIVQEVFG